MPLVVRSRTVAVLYADSAGLDSEAINLEALETLARVAGMAVELLSVSLAAAARSQAEPAAPAEPVAETIEAAPTYTPEREYEETPPAEPAPSAAAFVPSRFRARAALKAGCSSPAST